MEIIIDIFYAIVLFAAGFSLIKYRRIIKSWTGNFVWAERYLGSGGTYFVLILVWCFFMIWGVLYPFWWLELMFWVDSESKVEFKMN